jgi:hypothetical protein
LAFGRMPAVHTTFSVLISLPLSSFTRSAVTSVA